MCDDPQGPASLKVTLPDGSQLRGAANDRVPSSRSFKGIPFAVPPLGTLRWKHPSPAAPWDGVRDATRSPADSRCAAWDESRGRLRDGTSENCLYLDVYTPGSQAEAALPVAVWLHGGAWVAGSGQDFDGGRLTEEANLVVVSINYRLGILGWWGDEALRVRNAASGRGERSCTTGNWGLFDQRLALTWVQANIAAFGGDPSNVMLWGESAGAGSIAVHLTTEASFALFHKATMQSGGFANWNAASWHDKTERFAGIEKSSIATVLGCAEPLSILCFENAAVVDLLRAVSTVEDYIISADQMLAFPWCPTVDGVEVLAPPLQRLTAGDHKRCPIIIGTNDDEDFVFDPNAAPISVRTYDAFIDAASSPLATALQITPAQAVSLFMSWYPPATYEERHGLLPTSGWSVLARFDARWMSLDAYLADRDFSCSTRMAARMWRQSVFLYRFIATPLARNRIPFAFHGADVKFFSDTLDVTATASDRELASTMVALFSNFAHISLRSSERSGIPDATTVHLPAWMQYRPSGDADGEYMQFGSDAVVVVRGYREECEFVEPLVAAASSSVQVDVALSQSLCSGH